MTSYLPQIQTLTREADPSQAGKVRLFWEAMRNRYEHKSLGEVLQTEVFAGRPTEIPNLMRVFGTIGFGTGGFGSLFDIGFLEVLRNVIWNTSGDYSLPRSDIYDELDPGAEGLVLGLAFLAHATAEKFGKRDFGDIFRENTPITNIRVDRGTNKVVLVFQGTTIEFDYAIVATSTTAMQALGLDRDTPDGPFSSAQAHTKDSIAAVESIQAAIHQLNLVPAHKMILSVDPPDQVLHWPKDPTNLVTCFVTDRYPRVTTILPPQGLVMKAQAVVTSVGNDTVRLQNQDVTQKRLSFASAFDPQDDMTAWPQTVVAIAIRQASSASEADWSRTRYIAGGFKLDLPGHSYLSGSLFYQCQLAGSEERIAPYARVFLAGDSVGFLGGSAEGSAMSALNATTAVLTQIGQQAGTGGLGTCAPPR